MIEFPEAVVLSRQISDVLTGKMIRDVTVLQSPHKFASFHGEPREYPARLRGRSVSGATSHGGMVQILLGKISLAFQDGPNLRYAAEPASVPKKHQLLLDFTDGSFLCVSIRMYGGIACFDGTDWDNEYYRTAREKPSPLGDEFTRGYFKNLCQIPNFEKLSVKAFLATEQRVPGLGNGVLQDILFHAGIHPRTRTGTISQRGLGQLFLSIRSTLQAMVEGGGRDTETDLFGAPGGYRTILSRKTVGTPCPRCGAAIEKATYGGGSIYSCPTCQPVE